MRKNMFFSIFFVILQDLLCKSEHKMFYSAYQMYKYRTSVKNRLRNAPNSTWKLKKYKSFHSRGIFMLFGTPFAKFHTASPT